MLNRQWDILKTFATTIACKLNSSMVLYLLQGVQCESSEVTNDKVHDDALYTTDHGNRCIHIKVIMGNTVYLLNL